MSALALQYFVESLSEEARGDYLSLSAAASRGESDTCLFLAEKLKQRCVEQFRDGSVGIEQLAAVDGLCELVSSVVVGHGSGEPRPRTYNVNLSVFTSIPDFWGIGQLFPIVPIHRLAQRPSARGILSDLTCDSDGKVDRFIGGESSLPLHELGEDGGYYLGMFLGGAYEEALGGVHNLFGGPSVARVSQRDGPHGFAVTRAVPGASCSDVLRAMQHEPELMFEALKHRLEEIVGEDDGTAADLANSFHNMPYLAGFYGDGDVSESSASGEEEQWSYCCA